MKIQKPLFLIIFSVLCLTFVVDCLHLETDKQQLHHNRKISKQCCRQKGGFQCGRVIKDCCKPPQDVSVAEAQQNPSDYCVRSFLTKKCPGQKITGPCIYCEQMCEEEYGGIICGASPSGLPKCCLQQNCHSDFYQSLVTLKQCNKETTFNISGCVHDLGITNGLVESVGGFFYHQE